MYRAAMMRGTAALAAVAMVAAAAERPMTVLDEGSFWRFHVTLRRPLVPAAALRAAGVDATEPAVLPVRVPYRSYPGLTSLESAPPAAGWRRPEFDDAAWPRARAGAKWQGSIPHVVFVPGLEYSTSLLCLRGKFAVRARKASSRINPQTKRPIQVAAKVVPLFRPGKELKRQIEKKLKVTPRGVAKK